MSDCSAESRVLYAQAFAFLGNSLLEPMSQTESVALDPVFWDEFPDFGDARVAGALKACRAFAAGLHERIADAERAVECVSVEWTQLFVGPPKPAAAPWEGAYLDDGSASVGFGRSAFQMRELLRAEGLVVSNENNQYADHMGIELLYLSHLCNQSAGRGGDGPAVRAAAFAVDHPLAWICALTDRVGQSHPGGYVAVILELAHALLESFVSKNQEL